MLLRQLHAANQEEIDVGKLAVDKAQNLEVKKFAGQMVNDHTAADDKLTSLARRMNIDIDASPDNPVEKALGSASDDFKKSLRTMSAPQFDIAYFAPQADKHTLALKVVDEAQKMATGDVKKFLEETRPTVESHLAHAQAMMRSLSFAPAVGGGPMGREPAMPSMEKPSTEKVEHPRHDGVPKERSAK